MTSSRAPMHTAVAAKDTVSLTPQISTSTVIVGWVSGTAGSALVLKKELKIEVLLAAEDHAVVDSEPSTVSAARSRILPVHSLEITV